MEIEVRTRGDGLWRPELDATCDKQGAIVSQESDKCGEADQAGCSFIRWMTSFPRLA
jgi:hypothetical protein